MYEVVASLGSAHLGRMRRFQPVLGSQTPADGQYAEIKDPNQILGEGTVGFLHLQRGIE